MIVTRDPNTERISISLVGVCHDCKHQHNINVTPQGFTAAVWDWAYKHQGHDFEFLTPKRRIPANLDDRPFERIGQAPWWLEYKENADLKIAYAASAALTITLASLASSSTWLVGRQSTPVSNTTNKYVDYRIAGKITTGTTPTVDTEIRIYAFAGNDDTPNYPDAFSTADAARTITNAQILDQLPLLGYHLVSATSNVKYDFTQMRSLAAVYGFVPKDWGIYVAHNTGVNLNSTGGNHALNHTGVYFTSI